MLDAHNLYMFIAASFILCLAPGPDNIFVMTQGITRGKKAAVITTLGLCTGIIIHTAAAAFGISVIFQTSELAFNIVKYLGATYLMYLAFMAFKYRNEPLSLSETQSKKGMRSLYIKGFFMNVLNPKVSIFFLAFLPQFVTTANGNVPLQMIQLGVVFMVLTVIVFSSMGVVGSMLGQKILSKPSIAKYMNVITSGVFFSLGLKLALSER